MMNRISLLSFLLAFCCLTVSADEQKKITLGTDGHKKETIELFFCNLTVELDDVTDDGNAVLSVGVDNISETNTLIVFDHAYDEKTLKKITPSIRYDKIFPGSKGSRIIEYYPEIRNPFMVNPSQNQKVVTLTKTADSVIVCRLPIYIGKAKGKKLLLQEKVMVELDITVNVKPDSEFLDISNDCDDLIKKISRETFCNNRNHRGTSCKSLVKSYKSKIGDLKSRIEKLISARGYKSSDKKYSQLMNMNQRLDAVDFDNMSVSSCGKDSRGSGQRSSGSSASGHSCNYCSMSYEAIYRKMENYYIDIHNGKKSKGQVIGEVKAMNSCVQNNSRRSANAAIKSRIATYVKKIESAR